MGFADEAISTFKGGLLKEEIDTRLGPFKF
jgi:hypothetical protein